MNAEMPETTPKIGPPRVMPALVAGFNAVANHIQIILFPVALDILLWFGPHVRLKALVTPMLADFMRNLLQFSPPDMIEQVRATQDLWATALERYNLLSTLRTFPIGITSLMGAKGPMSTPFGPATIYEMPSVWLALVAWLLLIFLGLVGGSLYFNAVARLTAEPRDAFDLQQVLHQILQTLILCVALYAMAVMLFIPLSLMLSVLAMISMMLAQVAMLLLTFLFLWLFLLPLFFTPHGIYAMKQNAPAALLTSARLVRSFLPGAGLFLLVVLSFSQGLDLLWRTPEDKSWMLLVGVLGHAFTSTGLMAASFVYYRDGVRWMKENMQRLSVIQARS